MPQVKIFTGTASKYFAEKVVAAYGIPLGDATLQKFSDGEMAPHFNESVRGAEVFIIQSTFPPADNLLELMLMVDAAKHIGQPVAAVTDDITGAFRNVTTPDPGAYEFGVVSTNVGIIAISSPTSGCSLTNAETVTVTIRNFGSVPQSSIPVTFLVNGVVIPTANETFAGTIAPNTTANYTFTTKANLSVPGPYSIIAKTVLTGDTDAANDADTLNVVNSLFPTMPVSIDFETAMSGLPHMKTVIGLKAHIIEGAGASNGTGSTKGLIMDGVTDQNWVTPGLTTDPWTVNTDHLATAKFCINPAGGNPNDSLILTFDLKQLFKTANVNTNFRITANGTQVGATYRPPFTGTPITWKRIYVDLTSYKTLPTIEIGFESNVMEEYANGTANLIDNISIIHSYRAAPTGLRSEVLASQLHVFPNPSNGTFNIDLPAGKTYTLEVTDLSGKVIKKQTTTSGTSQLNLEGTAKGIYLLKVSGESGSAVRKLVVE